MTDCGWQIAYCGIQLHTWCVFCILFTAMESPPQHKHTHSHSSSPSLTISQGVLSSSCARSVQVEGETAGPAPKAEDQGEWCWPGAHAGDAGRALPPPDRLQFRVHPKGVGVVCVAPEGIEPETFVTEYHGELYPPWRWFEKQDAIKKCNPGMSLPDFYNICLERPRDDDQG